MKPIKSIKPTIVTFRQQKTDLEVKLSIITAKLRNHVGYSFIQTVEAKTNIMTSDYEFANLLAEELTERDEPMSYDDIKSVFEFADIVYQESHILAAKPDSQRVIDEQNAHYRE